jgi:hypothetical protein
LGDDDDNDDSQINFNGVVQLRYMLKKHLGVL